MGQRPVGMGQPPGQRLLGVAQHQIGVSQVGRQVDELVGVRLQVEEQRRKRGKMDVFVTLVLDHAEAGLVHRKPKHGLRLGVVHVTEVVFVVQLGAPAGRADALRERHHRSAVTGPWCLPAEPVEDRRHDVDAFRERGLDSPPARRCAARILDHERDTEALVVEADLAEQVVVAQLLAMVRREHDQRVVPLPGLVEIGEDLAEAVVDLGDQPAIGGAELGNLVCVQRRAGALGAVEERPAADRLDIVADQRMLGTLGLGRGGADRLRHVLWPVHRVVGRRGDEGRVRPVITEMQEERLAVTSLQVGQRPLGEEGRIGQLARNARRPVGGARHCILALGQPDVLAIVRQRKAVLRHPAEIAIHVGLERAHRAEPVHQVAQHQEARILRTRRPRIGRRRGVADQRRVIADRPQRLAEIEMALVQRNRVLHGPVIHQIEAGQQARPCRPAWHAGCHVVGEGDALGAEAVQVRRPEEGLDAPRPQEMRHEIRAPLVDDDEEDVATGHGRAQAIRKSRLALGNDAAMTHASCAMPVCQADSRSKAPTRGRGEAGREVIRVGQTSDCSRLRTGRPVGQLIRNTPVPRPFVGGRSGRFDTALR